MSEQCGYMAIAEWGGREWSVQVDGVGWPGRFHAEDLGEAKEAAEKLVWAYTGDRRPEVSIEVRLPGATADRLCVIGQYRQDLEVELLEAFAEMREIGLSAADIEHVFATSLDHSAANKAVKGDAWSGGRRLGSRRLILVDSDDQTSADPVREAVRPEAPAWG